MQYFTILGFGPDDTIEKLMDLLLERLASVHRWPVVVGVSFLFDLELALLRHSGHEGEDGAVVALDPAR